GLSSALFDPHSADSISRKITQALTDPKFLEQLRVNSREQAKKFSWDRTAQTAIAAFESLVNVKPKKVRRESVDRLKGGQVLNIEKIASVISNNRSFDLLSLSQVLARNITGQKRQLLVDVSELVQRDRHTGIQRV